MSGAGAGADKPTPVGVGDIEDTLGGGGGGGGVLPKRALVSKRATGQAEAAEAAECPDRAKDFQASHSFLEL